MQVTLKKKEDEEIEGQDDLPADEPEEIDEKAELERLKIENAEQRGRLSVLQSKETPRTLDARSAHEQAKQRVYADSNNLSDEDFEKAYNMPKHKAVSIMLDRDNVLTKDESAMAIAEAEAKTELAIKYGKDFYAIKSQVEETLSDLSPEARKDPKRLARHMERQYLAISTGARPAPKTRPNGERRQVVQDFEKPTPIIEKAKDTEDLEEIKDEVPAGSDISNRSIANMLGLHSEKERKEWQDVGDFVPMDMGGGKVFRDPKRGFEVVAKK